MGVAPQQMGQVPQTVGAGGASAANSRLKKNMKPDSQATRIHCGLPNPSTRLRNPL